MKKSITFILTFLLVASLTLAQNKTNKGSRDWSVVASYTIPGKASGLAYDGTYLYFGIYGSGGDEVYKFDPGTGTSSLQCTGSWDDAYGMSFSSPNLWTIDQPGSSNDPALATEFNMGGTTISTIALPDHYMSGIAADGSNFWVCTYYPDPGTVYEIDGSGNILSQFTPPADQPWDICLQDGDLWIADYWDETLYKVDQSGNVLESHPTENTKPAGIVYDGNFLWYVDGPLSSNSTLYKIDLGGAGTPEINVPVTSHNYGTVTVGSGETWQMQVQNTGTADLSITDIVIPSGEPVQTSFSTPHVIAPGGSVNVPITYFPLEIGELNTTITVQSTDPIDPEVDVDLTGNAVQGGPYIKISAESHDYGQVRQYAYTRWFLEIENQGDEELEITALNLGTERFMIDEAIELPLSISTLEIVEIGIWFNPLEGMPYEDTLEIVNNDNDVEVTLSGEGLKKSWPVGDELWSYTIDEGYDNSPKAIAPIQDITGDGVSDVIVCSEDNNIRCFNGNSSGTADVMWTREIYSGNIFQQQGLETIADLNGDGYQDVVVGTTGGDRSVYALSGKTGETIWKFDTHQFGGGGWVYQVNCTYDYNDDGSPDVLAATGDDSNDTGPKRVLCIDGKTGEAIFTTFLGGPVFAVIGVEDFTGDGIPDVLAGASNENESQGIAYGIDGSDGSTEWSFNAGGSSVWAVLQLDDINGDGRKDVAIGDFGGSFFFIDPVDGSELESGAIGGEIILRFENMSDVNGDGYRDFIVAHSGDDGIVINGYDASTVWFVSIPDNSWNVANIKDITGDGINDAIIGTLYSNNSCLFLDGTDGSEVESVPYPSPVDAINSIPDIVGDLSMEMVAGGRNGLVTCYSGGYNTITISGEHAAQDKLIRVSPNPLRTHAQIEFELEEQSQVKVDVYNISGTLINRLTDSELKSGKHSILWNADNYSGDKVSPGFYIVSFVIGDQTVTRKIAVAE